MMYYKMKPGHVPMSARSANKELLFNDQHTHTYIFSSTAVANTNFACVLSGLVEKMYGCLQGRRRPCKLGG